MIELTRAANQKVITVNPDAIRDARPYEGEGYSEGEARITYRDGKKVVVEQTPERVKELSNRPRHVLHKVLRDLQKSLQRYF